VSIRAFTLLLSACLLTACSDSTAPHSIVGRYTFTSFTTHAPTGIPSAFPAIPLVALDSIASEIQLRADSTYIETGYIASTSTGGSPPPSVVLVDLQASGTYTLSGTQITLTPTAGATGTVWVGTVVEGILSIERNPGTWRYARR
jgi:hypothetical protein